MHKHYKRGKINTARRPVFILTKTVFVLSNELFIVFGYKIDGKAIENDMIINMR